MKIAVIGYGSIGQRHAINLRRLGCDVDAYDTDPAKGLPHPGHVLETRHDAWVIATPYTSHLSWVKLALDVGVPFFVEKPLGPVEELDAWRQIVASWGDTTPIHQVGYHCRFVDEAQTIKAHVAREKSRVITVRCEVDMDTWPGIYGDPLLECSHDLDLALWWGAAPTVTEIVTLDRPMPDEDWFYLGDTPQASCWLRYRCDHPLGWEREWSCDGTAYGYQTAWWKDRPIPESAYVREMEHFLEDVRGEYLTNGEPAARIADGIAVLDVCRQVQDMKHAMPAATRETP